LQLTKRHEKRYQLTKCYCFSYWFLWSGSAVV